MRELSDLALAHQLDSFLSLCERRRITLEAFLEMKDFSPDDKAWLRKRVQQVR